jgi:hypothetical protein
MPTSNQLLPERRLSATERRAGRKFIAQLMEKFPRLGRLAYPTRGDEGIVYIKMFVPEQEQVSVDELAAALTGLVYEQEKTRVFLISDDFPMTEPITNDDELKSSQAQLSCDVDCLRKLKKFKDLEAEKQREYYQTRYKANVERIIAYLSK